VSKKVFNKILVSKYSPKNGCNVEDGKILSIIPLKNFPERKSVIPYNFIDAQKRSNKSKFGWVKEVEPFTIDDFVKNYLNNRVEDELELESLELLFTSIKDLNPDTPVGATYKTRLVNYKPIMVLLIHKVKFY
jgi:hypothetical protein